MLRLYTTIALASLSLAVIQPMGVAGAKANSSTPGEVLPIQDDSGLGLTHGAAKLGRRAVPPNCSSGTYPSGSQCLNCNKGYYCIGGTNAPTACPPGTYNDQPSSGDANACKNVQCGSKPTGYQAGFLAATNQVACGKGSYSAEKSTTCTACPAGYYCNADTTCSPNPCDPGTYADQPGSGQQCKNCPAGTFNNSYGNTSCCNCCAGWFSSGDNVHTNCQQCPNVGPIQAKDVTSKPGSTGPADCSPYVAGVSVYKQAPTCSQDRPSTKVPGVCPAQTGMSGTMALTRRNITKCYYGKTKCEVKSGRGGWECVDTQNSLETCGGCDNDCSAMAGTNEVGCVKGHCVVKSCANGYALARRGDGISRGGLDVGQHCVATKKRDTHRARSSMF